MLITPLPQTIQQAWGDLAVREFTEWLEVLMAERAVGPPEFERMGEQMAATQADLSTFAQRFDGVEQRLDGVEQRLDGVEKRLDGVEQRLDGVEKRLDGVETRLTMVEHDLAEMKTDLREFRRELNERLLQLDDRLDRISGQMNERLDRILPEIALQFDRLNDRTASHLRWSVSLVAVFGTLVTILIALGQLRP